MIGSKRISGIIIVCFLLAQFVFAGLTLAQEGPLASWNEGSAKSAILEFVAETTKPASPDYVAPEERIAVFDNDGTLWSEKPLYFQVMMAIDQLQAMATETPEWAENQPFKAALEEDFGAVAASGGKGLMKLLSATQSGSSDRTFTREVEAWLDTARHPRFGKTFTELVYQPMLELLDYLRTHGFSTWIVSGSGIDFMRAWTEEAYGIPPEQVIGSQVELDYVMDGGTPSFQRRPGNFFFNDGPNKAIAIKRHMGRQPVIAFGNSDGDLEMLEWTTAGEGPRLGVLIHHTDAKREWAYDRKSDIGRLDKALDAAPEHDWLVVDMAADWARIYPWQTAP
ncbi:HAD family hydrolase [Fodinicurvata sediminis]|uniref:HAD family hydrolase n=1 Tax=Fodinicurvata sediminis TaxID=1121832 RepID=UPI0003B673D0|nr:HAD family hydrolase [Fodinicurvata sediminis]